MRSLTKGERQKLVILGIAAFLVAHIVLFRILQREFADTVAHLQQLTADRAYSRQWMSEEKLWAERGAWLVKTQPKLPANAQANVALLQALQKSATESGLTLTQQTLKDPRTAPGYREAAVTLELTGSLDSLCRWMPSVQQPGLFQAIPSFAIRSEGDSGTVRCSLTVARWYSLQ